MEQENRGEANNRWIALSLKWESPPSIPPSTSSSSLPPSTVVPVLWGKGLNGSTGPNQGLRQDRQLNSAQRSNMPLQGVPPHWCLCTFLDHFRHFLEYRHWKTFHQPYERSLNWNTAPPPPPPPRHLPTVRQGLRLLPLLEINKIKVQFVHGPGFFPFLFLHAGAINQLTEVTMVLRVLSSDHVLIKPSECQTSMRWLWWIALDERHRKRH